MKASSKNVDMVRKQWQLMRENAKVWLVPTFVIGLLGTGYALLRPPTWVASQGLLVRDEAVGELSRSGRFGTTDARKAAQEMILQIARNRQVVQNALEELEGSEKKSEPSQITPSDVSAFLDGITLTVPKGAEFGQTEVIYLQVKGGSVDQAVQRVKALTRHVQLHLSELRNRRTESVIRELTERLKLTQENLDESTRILETMEREVGSDLGELRTLSQTGTGESNLRTALTQIKNDLRNARAARTEQEEQLLFLTNARANPATIVATSNRLLESQPALRRLKDGLVDAQLRVAELLGKMNATHPSVRAAQAAEAEIRNDLYEELETAIRGLQADADVTSALIQSHEHQMADVQDRLNKLASMRARYEILVANVQDRSEQVKESQRALAEARASRQAAHKASLITPTGKPDVGDGPVGPGRLMLMIASWMGGLGVGLGCFFLLVDPSTEKGQRSVGRRWTDRVAAAGRVLGRRQADQAVAATPELPATGRRQSDRAGVPIQTTPPQRRACDAAPPRGASSSAVPPAPPAANPTGKSPLPPLQIDLPTDGSLKDV